MDIGYITYLPLFAVCLSVRALLTLTRRHGAMGRAGAVMVQTALILTQMGACTSYVICTALHLHLCLFCTCVPVEYTCRGCISI